MNTDKLDRIALEVAKEMYPHWPDENVRSSALPEFARRLVARLQQEAEPVAEVAPSKDDSGIMSVNWSDAADVGRLRFGDKLYPFPPAQPAQSAEVPEGMVLVPKRITDEMYDAWADDDGDIQTAWDAMLAAAPARPVGGEGE